MRRVIALVALGIALLLTPRIAAAQGKVGIIDTERAVLETDDGQRAQATLKKLFDTRQADLDTKQRALQHDKEALEKEIAAGKTPRNALQKKADALQKRVLELQQSYADSQSEMQKKRAELTKPIVEKMMAVVRTLAMQDGYDAVIDKSAVPYHRPDIELTNRAIQAYNAGQTTSMPAVKPTGSPKPAGNARRPAPQSAPKR